MSEAANHKIPRTKETAVGICALVVGILNIGMNVYLATEGKIIFPIIGISLVGLGIFWLSGGLTGHGSL